MKISEQEAVKKADSFCNEFKYKKAKNFLKKCMKNYPQNPHFFALYGWCLYSQKNYHEAVFYFSSALEIKPNSPTTYYFRAQCYEEINAIEMALSDYIKSNEILPSVDCMINIGLILRFRKNFSQSLHYFQEALKKDPENETVINLLKRF